MDALILIEQNNIAVPTHDFGNHVFAKGSPNSLTVANLNCRIRSNPEVQTSQSDPIRCLRKSMQNMERVSRIITVLLGQMDARRGGFAERIKRRFSFA